MEKVRQVIDVFRKWYIEHEDIQNPENGIAYFGPFRGWEIVKRVNDSYADLLAGCGNIDEVQLSKAYVKTHYINPRKFWMNQLKELDNG